MFYEENNNLFDNCSIMNKAVNIPIELYESLIGRYFVGYSDNLSFGKGKSAWARLYNPRRSGVNLHVNVWTVSDISQAPFSAEFWFNADPSGNIEVSNFVTPSNTALYPLPSPKIELQSASNVDSEPTDGVKAFIRNGQPGTTLVDTENGKFIFPPGGSFLVFISLQDGATIPATGRIAFGWWEQRISEGCIG